MPWAKRLSWSLVKGSLFKAYCHLFHPNVKVGKKVRVSIWPRVAGPGRIHIGDKVCFVDNHSCRTQLITYSKDASISIGAGTVLGGTHIFCMQNVRVGVKSLLGMATVMDTDVLPCDEYTALGKFRRPHATPVILGSNVWLGTFSIVTKGVTLADDSVVGAGSVVFEHPENTKSLFIGNPARRLGVLF